MLMKKKRRFFLTTVVFCCIAAAVLYVGLNKTGERIRFQRLSFQTVQKTEELHFDKTNHRWSSPAGKKIPFVSSISRGTGILFDGTGEIKLQPGITGKKGIFFRLNVRSFNKGKITLTIRVKRGDTVLEQEKVQSGKKGRIYHAFSKTREFSKDDLILIRAIGKGALITGDAVIYDLIAKEKQNHVFIIALDTLRWDKIGQRVDGIDLTPNLDRFKQDAVVFEQAFAQSPWTLPSFTAFFTGLYEFNSRVFRHRVLDSRNPFLIENFSKQYMTASINGGTWLIGKTGNSRGFDSYEVGSGARDVYAGKILFEKSIEFIEKNRAPDLFLFMHTYAIHAPYIPPREFLHKLNKKPRFTARNTYARNRQFKKNVPSEIKKAMEELYDAEIMAFDSYFGEFIAYLKRNGLYDRSSIVFFSDHGEEFYDHLGWSHGHSLHNELIKVPLIIKFPGDIYQSLRVKEIVGIIDILPTLLDYLRIEQDREIDGVSLMPLIKQAAMPSADREGEKNKNYRKNRGFLVSSLATCPFFDQVPKKVAILFDHYKLIYNFAVSETDKTFFRVAGLPPEVPWFQVFDLINDPLEKHNLYPGCMNLIKDYREDLNDILKKIRFILKRKKSAEIELSDEEIEKLKALGYL